MKNLLKILLKKNNIILAVIIAFAFLVRFYNFPNRITFWTEQAKSMIVAADYLKKPSLLGQEYFRQDSNGHKIFSGAIFNYSLVPFYILTRGDPNLITAYFALLNIFTGFIVYYLAKRLFGFKIATISSFLFLFNNYMIYHSLFIWNYNYLPLIGILLVYLTWGNLKKAKKSNFFLLGLISGIGISLQVLFVLIAGLVFIVNIWKSDEKLSKTTVFLGGIILGNLPMFIFDLRHNFYQTQTLWLYFKDTLNGTSGASLAYYYFLPFWPAGALLAGFLLSKLRKILIILILSVYLAANLSSKIVNFNSPTGMPQGIVLQDINSASRKIANDAQNNFNVAEVLDFDKRAYVLRYYVQYKYGKNPEGETQYQGLDVLYVLSQKDYDFNSSDVWEIKSGGHYNITKLADVDSNYAIYKLTK